MNHLSSSARWGRVLKQWLLLAVPFLAPSISQAQTATTVVISEVFGGGGNASAPYTNDFVELYNPTSAAISLVGYSVQYNGANGTGGYTPVTLTGSIPANGFYLVQFGSSGAVGAPLPTPNATAGTNMAAGAGRVALVNGTAALSNSARATDPGIVDFVGYGSAAAEFEGANYAPAPSATTSIERKARVTSTSASMAVGGLDADEGNGYDSNNNNLDFVTRAMPNPQNSGSASESITQTIIFYSTKNNAGPLNNTTTFSSTLDGTGPSPSDFATAYQTFVVTGSNRTLTAPWNVTGNNSKVELASGASFIVPAAYNFTGSLDLNSGSTLVEQNAAPAVTFGTVDANSTVEYAQTSGTFTVPALASPGYGNLTLRNATKLLSTGITTVRGNFLVSNVGASGTDVLGGASTAGSTLNLGGNFTLSGTVGFSTTGDDRIALNLTNTSTPQTLDGGGNTIKLFKITLPTGQAGASLAGSTSNLELGNATGGGYQLATGTTLALNSNTLSFAPGGSAAITGGTAFTGMLDLTAASSLAFNRGASGGVGTLLLTPTSTQLNNFTLNLSTAGTTFTLPTSLTVNGTLALTQGTFILTPNTVLTLNGPVNPAGGTGTLRGNTADLVIGGSGTLGVLNLGGGTTGAFQSFTLNRDTQTLTATNSIVTNVALNVLAGTLDLAGKNLTLNGTVTVSGSGLVNGASGSDIIVGGAGPLGNLRFTATGGLLDILTLNRPNGTLLLEGNPLQIAKPTLTSGVLSLGTGFALNISGLLVVDDPTVAQFAATSTSTLNFTGTGNIGTLAFVTGQNNLQNLIMARSGTATTAPTAQLITDLNVGNLTLNGGKIFVQEPANLVLLTGGGLTGGGNTSFVNKLTRTSVTNATTTPSLTSSLTFPLGAAGTGNQYRPLTLALTDLTTNTASYTARVIDSPSPSRTLPASLARVSQIRYYNVVHTGTSTGILRSATITLTYGSDDLVTTSTVSFLRVAMTDPMDPTRWYNAGGSGNGSTITSAPFADGALGDFTLATDILTPGNNNPLPVELTRFVATRQTAGVHLAWATASEKNSDRFEVERSLDGVTFASVLSVTAHGNTTQAHEYTALDAKAPAGQLYYRLRQVDLDGTVAYSPIVSVAGADASVTWTLYPNPATERLTASLPAAEGRTYRVLNVLGQVLQHGSAATADPAIDVRALPAGTYLLELRSAGNQQTRRFVKND